jgi:tripartite-type tricarboxylate transporter receptor subunit TctC
MRSRREALATLGGAAATPLLARGAFAQAYPSRLIKIIVPGTPGGPTDVMGRLMAQRMQPALGQSIVIENQPGGGGSVAATQVARAEPDGYTLLFCNTSIMATIPAVSKKPTYDPVKEFAPVAKVSQAEQVLVLHPDVPPKSVQEFIAFCKANPGKLNCAATGFGGLPHLTAEYFKAKANVDFAIVPYKGGGDSLTAVLGHQCDLTFETTTVVLPYIREGKLKALGISSEKRHPLAPEIPTIQESGVDGYIVPSFNGVVAPAATPAAVVARLNSTINDILKSDDGQRDIARLGGVLDIGSPEDFAAFIAREAKRWRDVADAGNIKVD